MSKRKPKDTDYLYLSAYLRAMESQLLTRERLERMLEARSNEDAAKVLTECGYEGLEPLTAGNLEESLRKSRQDTFALVSEAAPDPAIVDLFRLKYDYHNLKAIVKCAATGQDPERLLMAGGRVEPAVLRDAVARDELENLPEDLREAIPQARELLSATGDPQKSDFFLDRAWYKVLTATAEKTRSEFLKGYAALLIDSANLRSAVRTLRMKKDRSFLERVLSPGGTVSTEAIADAVTAGDSLEPLFPDSLQAAAALGDQIRDGGPQTAFEKACDDAVNEYLRQAKMVPFGEQVLAAYIAARENDITAARVILSGRLAGVPAESIRERLRDAYV